jgi:4-amino-4-deoxy-L-arabinose transferase-like glycosyltransferase
VLALLIRLAYHYFARHTVGQISDATAYHLLGKNLAAGRGYIRPFDYQLFGVHRATSEYPPLFPAFLAVLSILGAGSVTAQQVALAFVGTGTVVVTGLIGREVMGDAVGLVAAAIAAISPMLFQADGILMTESLTALLVALCVLAAIKVRERPTPWGFVGLGALLGVTTLNRAEGLLLAPLLVLPIAFRARSVDGKRRAVFALAGLGTFVLVLAPWTIYNAQRFRTFVPVSNNLGTVLEGANCPLTYSGPYLGSWRSEFANGQGANFVCFGGFHIEDPKFDEASAAAASRRRGVDYAKAHKRAWPRVAAARLGRTWGVFRPAQQVNLAVLEGRNHTWETYGTWFTWLLLPLAVAGIVILLRRRRVVWPLVAPIVTVSIVSVLTYGNQRFRIGADPMLAVLAAVSIVTAASRIRTTSPATR